MTGFINDKVKDQALEYIKANGDKLVINNTSSTDYATVVDDDNILGEKALTTANFTIEDSKGSAGGRTVKLTNVGTVTATASGSFRQIAILDTTETRILMSLDAKQNRAINTGDVLSVDEESYTITDAI